MLNNKKKLESYFYWKNETKEMKTSYYSWEVLKMTVKVEIKRT